MQISVPKESKNHEYRVGLTPSSVFELTCADHEVAVQTQAGTAIGYEDAAYVQAGARIVGAEEAFAGELIVRVKEPSVQECRRLDHGQILFYLPPSGHSTGASPRVAEPGSHRHRL